MKAHFFAIIESLLFLSVEMKTCWTTVLRVPECKFCVVIKDTCVIKHCTNMCLDIAILINN